jgi:hypothetical protein
MSPSNASDEYSDGPSHTVENAHDLLRQALTILDDHEAPAELRARLSEVIESVEAYLGD